MSDKALLAFALLNPTASYVLASVVYVARKDYGHALAFFSYALANLGFLYATR